jgi:hypothetical protein
MLPPSSGRRSLRGSLKLSYFPTRLHNIQNTLHDILSYAGVVEQAAENIGSTGRVTGELLKVHKTELAGVNS